jgi:hypothetical protein
MLQVGLVLSLSNCDVEVMEIAAGRDEIDHFEDSKFTFPQLDTISYQGSLIRVDNSPGVIPSAYDITDFVICRHEKALTGWPGVDGVT